MSGCRSRIRVRRKKIIRVKRLGKTKRPERIKRIEIIFFFYQSINFTFAHFTSIYFAPTYFIFTHFAPIYFIAKFALIQLVFQPYSQTNFITLLHQIIGVRLGIYITKVAVKKFSPYIHFCKLAAYCFLLCNNIPSLGPSLNKEEIILKSFWY